MELKGGGGLLETATPVPCRNGLVTATMVIYWGGFHLPLGLGGLSIVAKIFPQRASDPEFQAITRVVLQLLELAGTAYGSSNPLQPLKPQFELFNMSFSKTVLDRGWIPASALGLLVVLLIVIAAASITQYILPPELRRLLQLLQVSSPVPLLHAQLLSFCVITPIKEEYVYRGFLLAPLDSHTRWGFAIIVSSLLFAISHLGTTRLPLLFMIGCVLGASYTWTGNLATSLVIHGLYNVIVLTRSVLF